MKLATLYDIIRRPVVTEKSSVLGEYNQYVFIVSQFSTKSSIKRAVESIFDVKVRSVNVLNQNGKVKKFKGTVGRRSNTKKAFVTLHSDHTIDLSGGVK